MIDGSVCLIFVDDFIIYIGIWLGSGDIINDEDSFEILISIIGFFDGYCFCGIVMIVFGDVMVIK